MSLNYHAEVHIDTPDGVLSLYSGDVSAVDPFLADGLSIGWTREDTAAPGQPEPVEARFAIVAPGPVPIDIGARVAVLAYDAPPPIGDEVATFYGRVAEVSDQPVEYGNPGGSGNLLGQLFDVVCVDYTVDLAEVEATTGLLASNDAVNRMRAYLDAAATQGVPGGLVSGESGTLDGWVRVKAEDPTTGPALARIVGVMDQVGADALPGDDPAGTEPKATALDKRLARRAVFAPRVDAAVLPGELADPGGNVSWAIDVPPAYWDQTDPDNFPAVLTLGSGGWGLEMDPDSPVVVPALRVDGAAKWTRSKFSHPNRVTIGYTPVSTGDETVATVDSGDKATGDPVVSLRLDAPLLGDVMATYGFTEDYGPLRMALMYLPENDARDRWTADAWRHYIEAWDQLLAFPWFPRHADIDPTPGFDPGDPTSRVACYGMPVVVSGIDPAQHPTGRSWYAGTLSAAKLTLADARPTLEFTVRRVLPIPAGAGALTPADVDPAITVADLDPSFTVYDYRLARGA